MKLNTTQNRKAMKISSRHSVSDVGKTNLWSLDIITISEVSSSVKRIMIYKITQALEWCIIEMWHHVGPQRFLTFSRSIFTTSQWSTQRRGLQPTWYLRLGGAAGGRPDLLIFIREHLPCKYSGITVRPSSPTPNLSIFMRWNDVNSENNMINIYADNVDVMWRGEEKWTSD